MQILADALPKIVPYVLINHREVFYPPFLRALITMILYMILFNCICSSYLLGLILPAKFGTHVPLTSVGVITTHYVCY